MSYSIERFHASSKKYLLDILISESGNHPIRPQRRSQLEALGDSTSDCLNFDFMKALRPHAAHWSIKRLIKLWIIT